MTSSLADDGSVGDSTSASAWTLLFEDLLAGIIHAMNNAITVLGVSIELGPAESAPGDNAVLRSELTKIQNMIELTSALSVRSRRTEALDLRAVLDLALTVHALNPATRSVACSVNTTGVIPPVRVPRSVLLRVLLLLIDAAKRENDGEPTGVTIDLFGDATRVVVQTQCGEKLGNDTHGFAEACGGTLTLSDGHAVFELPSLERLRRPSPA